MRKLVWRDTDGTVINIGPWDYAIRATVVEGPDEADRVGNPLPPGATSALEEVVRRADGGWAAADDYASMRRAAYPPMRDQLDALWKGGEDRAAMQAAVQAVKTRFPKPDPSR